MAIKYWFGLVPGSEYDYSVATNWVPVNVPVANDDVVIGLTNASILYGLDQSAVALDTFTVRSSYTGQLGTATSPLKIDVDEVVTLQGMNDAFITLTGTTGMKLKVERGEEGGGTYYVTNGESDLSVDVVSGKLVLRGSTNDLLITHRGTFPGDGHVVYESGTLALCEVHAGTFELLSGTVGVSTGTLTVYDGTAIVYDGTIGGAGAKVNGSGTLDYRSSVTLAALQMRGAGTCTLANDQRPKTVSAAYLVGSPTLNADNGANNIALTSVTSYGVPTIIRQKDTQTVTIT